MNRWRFGCITIIFFFIMMGDAMVLQADKSGSRDIRPAAVAGKFYPESSPVLKQAIEAYLSDAIPVGVKSPLAIIAPHAGYIFSGQICADAYNQVRSQTYDTIVILGTNHTSPRFDQIAIYPGDGFETPLGIVRVDKDLVADLLAADHHCVLNASVHETEHSVEVQVPFVQVLFPQAKIVPIVVGAPDPTLCRHFGEKLAKVLMGRRALIVASSDLSHYPSYQDAVTVDRETLQAIAGMDPDALHSTLSSYHNRRIDNLHTEACGEAPILAAMYASKALGAKGARIISYANSGDVSIGESDRVVGYGAVVFTENKVPSSFPDKQTAPDAITRDLPDSDKKALLAFARKSITWFLKTHTVPLARGLSSQVEQPQGVFVTLKKHGDLRGCIGRIIPDAPLKRLVGSMALQSAFNDPRFPALTLDELSQIEIEMSVLTPIKSIAQVEDIVVGRDGVILQKGGRSAVFLPQVAPEQGWTREQMLDQLALKAGLTKDAWRTGAQFSTFQAIVFSE